MANLIRLARDASLQRRATWAHGEPITMKGVPHEWRVWIRGIEVRSKLDGMGGMTHDWFPLTDAAVKGASVEPILILKHITKGAYWLYKREIYVSPDLKLSQADVVALVNEHDNKRRLALEKAHVLQAMTEQLDLRGRRERIPQDVKVTVWQRDSGRCVECGSQKDLEFDHIIPLAMGGSNTMRNLQLLCAPCNLNRPDFRSYREPCPAGAGLADSRSA